ncbi:DUF1003 domain-containing protein [Gallaecimonas kandeliae]|uniref:DUF1003 domain-containing protein n=1 Tax=Gallaecimonas kandeliae TaxID=3029055 RepID=UPI0026483EB9|nr:DUF1003 domain-containing protein [Gallaecimonas kandeliae]WKE64315.1 DUF1003 domain-containing protein [Gallaecimonas kandeliae]
MTTKSNSRHRCAVCNQSLAERELVAGELVREGVAAEIQKAVPGWGPGSYICHPCLAEARGRYVHRLLESEKGELSGLEQEVLESLKQHELVSEDIEAQFDRQWSLGERLADKLADFGGSWTFLVLFAFFLLAWVALNSFALLTRPPDPYPYIFLNLMLSCLAAIQAPIIMMSQNRQEAKDRARSQHDYQVNLKAELEIRHLHEKMDHLIFHQWQRLVRIQELQLELLAELENRK